MQVIVERVIELSVKGDCPADADLFFALVQLGDHAGLILEMVQALEALAASCWIDYSADYSPDVDAATEKARAVVAKLESIRVARSPSAR